MAVVYWNRNGETVKHRIKVESVHAAEDNQRYALERTEYEQIVESLDLPALIRFINAKPRGLLWVCLHCNTTNVPTQSSCVNCGTAHTP